MNRTSKQKFDRTLLCVIDGSLAGVVFLVPLLMGGRHAIGHLGLTALVVTIAAAWLVRQCLSDQAAWHGGKATVILLLALFLAALQTIPLPTWLLDSLSPHVRGLLSLWGHEGNGQLTFGVWPCLSFTPAETQSGLILLVNFCLLFFVTIHRVECVDDIERLLRWCGLSAVLMASFGLVQFLFGNGKFFWFYQYPFSDTLDAAKGSFTNRNHFAHFLALGIGPLIWWLVKASSQARSASRTKGELSVPLLGLALGGLLFAGFLSLSRGGMLAMLTAMLLYMAIGYRTLLLGKRPLIALAATGVLAAAGLMLFGFDKVSRRVEELTSGSIEDVDRFAGRRTIWAGTAKAASDSMIFGTGVGSFASVYPVYGEVAIEKDISPTHAENGYLQILLETGLLGFGLLTAGIVLCLSCCVRGFQNRANPCLQACFVAITASLGASLLHAMFDFVWYAPGCMAVTVILASCAYRGRLLLPNKPARQVTRNSHSLENDQYKPIFFPRAFWAGTAVVVVLVGAMMLVDRLYAAVAQPYWDEYLVERQIADSRALANPGESVDAATLERWVGCLQQVVRWQPTHFQAHLALAEAHRRLFDVGQMGSENGMSFADIRDAATRSQFASWEALEAWLSRAIGSHWRHLPDSLKHARKALRLSPLEGRAYIYVAELSFLFNADNAGRQTYIEQALRVRPLDAAVLYAAANDSLLAGDTERWLGYLKPAFRSGIRQQRRIIGDLVTSTPAENLPAVIDFVLRELQPDLEVMQFFRETCRQRTTVPLSAIDQYWVTKAEGEATSTGGTAAAAHWLTAARLYNNLNDQAGARRCLEQAMQADPDDFSAHRDYATQRLRESQFAEAEMHFRWCTQRRPNDKAVEKLLREALKGRLDNERRAGLPQEQLR